MSRPNYDESTMDDIATQGEALDLTFPNPLLDAVERIAANVERIADQGAEADVHVTIEQVHEAWDAIGQRAEHHLAVDLVEKLGIVVDA